jgi:hypothetical protein
MENLVQAPSHYVWEVAGKPVSIHLDFNVLDRMAMDVMRGFGAVPKRGAEVGGLLVGSFDSSGEKLVVKIEDFVPVTCDHLKGPSYLLTEKDEARFRDTVNRIKAGGEGEPKLVGYYRSHTRDGLGLSDEDIQLIERYLGDASQIALLIRPYATRTSIGAFFFQENGGFRRESSYQEFPFKRRDLGGGASPIVRNFTSDPATVDSIGDDPSGPDLREWVKARGGEGRGSTARAERPRPQAASTPAQFRSKWVWIPLSFVFLVVGVVVGFQSAMMLNRGDLTKSAASALTLGLSASSESGKVVVRWDRNAIAIQNASSGTLRILDGDFSKMVNLDTRQLQNGSVIYMSAENRVGFRLEILTQQKTMISESTDYAPAPR